jgi:drug/metabolite transporter (DMT)-like permease
MAIGLGLLAALVWGISDLLIRMIGRRFGVHRAMLWAQGTGAVGLGIWVCASPAARQALGSASLPGWAAAAAIGPIGLLATSAGYRALQRGRIAVVVPTVGAYGAVTAVLAWLGGEPVAPMQAAGLVLAVLGVVLVSVPPRTATERPGASGFGAALVACVGYGLQFWLQGRYAVPALGPLVPVWLYYMFSTASLAAWAARQRTALRLRPAELLLVVVTGIVAVGGYVVVSAGLATGQIAVVTVLTSLQSAVTIGAAWLLWRERLAPHQWLGAAAVIGGLVLLRAGAAG